MSAATIDELNRFYQFAQEKLSNGGSELTLEELVDLWQFENPTPERRQADLLAVKEALSDLDNGDRGIPHEDFMHELRKKYGVAEE